MFSRPLYQTKNLCLAKKKKKTFRSLFWSKQMCTPKLILPRAVHQEMNAYHYPVKPSQFHWSEWENSEQKHFQPAKLVHLSRVFLSSHDYNSSFIYQQGCWQLIPLTSLTLEMSSCVCRALGLYWLDELNWRRIQMPVLETPSKSWTCTSISCRPGWNHADAWAPPRGLVQSQLGFENLHF